MIETGTELDEFIPVISRVAKRVHKDYQQCFELSDLEQELVCFVLKRRSSKENPLPLPSERKLNIQSFLTREARTWAFKQKQQHYLTDVAFSYEMSDVKQILETHFHKEMWDAVRDGETVEDMITAHSDVAWALDRMSAEDKDFIRECYLAERLPRAGTPEYRKLRDTIIKLTNMCNHYTRREEPKGPGSRTVMTNATAQSLIDACGEKFTANGKEIQ